MIFLESAQALRERAVRVPACIALCVLLLSHLANAQMPFGMPGGMAVNAGYITPERQQVPLTGLLSGKAIAEDDATIRPLVDGVITDILYEAGSEVSAGTPLFQIESETYKAALDVAKAELESAQAAVPAAEENLKRYEKLAGSGVTEAEVDSVRKELRQAQAAVRSATADLRKAQINLDRTTIRSPVDGIVAEALVSKGDLVTAGQSDVLTSVTQLDPISVDIAESSSRMLDVRKKIASGEITRGSKVLAELILENGEKYASTGVVKTVGSKVSSTTGTVTIRVLFDNAEHLILPGVFLRVRLTVGSIDAVLVPQLAATPQADGTLSIWVLSEDNKAQKRSVVPSGSTENAWIVPTGLDNGTRLLVDNLTRLAEGGAVNPIPVSINAAGIIVDAPMANPPAGAK